MITPESEDPLLVQLQHSAFNLKCQLAAQIVCAPVGSVAYSQIVGYVQHGRATEKAVDLAEAIINECVKRVPGA